jgi:hypothetical protein
MQEAEEQKKSPKGIYLGDLTIGDMELSCAVLEDGTRVLSQKGVNEALNIPEGGSKDTSRKLPRFFEIKALQSFISNDLAARASQPLVYMGKGGKTNGVPATLLPDICDVWLKAREAGKLEGRRLETARKAEVIMRGLAHIGIVALVDEATGYQEVRNKAELRQILSAYIAKELLPWSLKFPHEFYQEMFRLNGWEYEASSKQKKPMLAGKYTKQYVYDALPKGVIEEIKKINPKRTSGAAAGLHEKHHHRFLTKEIGHPHLDKLIASVTTLMRISPTWRKFQEHYQRAFGKQQVMDFPEQAEQTSAEKVI